MLNRRKLVAAGGLASLLAGLPSWAAQARKLTVIGATARSGRVIIKQALAQGYQVTGLARSPEKFGATHPSLKLVKGDVRDVDSLAAAMNGDEVIICVVGFPTPKDPTREVGEVDLYTVMAANLRTAMMLKGNSRLIIASSTGVETRVERDATAPASNNPTDAWRFNARYLYADMADMEEMLLYGALDTVILRPGFLVEEPARNNLKFSTSGDTPPARVVTYEDFANFTLAQVDSDEYLGRPVGIYSDVVMDPMAELKKYQEKMRLQNQNK